jgi:nascent polypeptide-associated complex subunit alpha
MFGGLNPKKMQAMMRQMGIASEEITASRVIIEQKDGTNLIIENPQITRIKMQGQESFQIAGEIKQETKEEEITTEDIKTIIEQTGCSEETAKETLEKNKGDLAQTIIDLS